jgi:cation transport ATPase
MNNYNPVVNGQGFNSNVADSNLGYYSNLNNLPNNNLDHIEPLQNNNIIVNIEVQMPVGLPCQEPIYQMGVDNSNKQIKDTDEKRKNQKRENAKTRIEVCKFLNKILMIIIIFSVVLCSVLIILGALLKSNASNVVGNLVISFAVVCIFFFVYGWKSFSKYIFYK